MFRLIPALWLVGCGGDDPSTPTDSVTTPPDCDVSWELFVEPTLRNWCVPCHSVNVPEEDRRGAPLGVDFDTWEASNQWAVRIAARVLDDERPMPPAGGLADWEREDLATWAACGAEGTPTPADPCDDPVVVDGSPADPCASGEGVFLSGGLPLDADPGATLDCVCGVGQDLVVGQGAGEVRLPRLRSVGGDLSASGTTLAVLVLPQLESVGGSVVFQDASPRELDLDHLQSIGGALQVLRGALPETFGPAWLTDVGGAMTLEEVGGLVVLDLPRLERVGGDLVVRANPALARVLHTSDLETVGGALRILDNPSLTAIEDFTFLASVGGDLEIGGNAVSSYDAFYQLQSVGGSLVLRDDLTSSTIDALHNLVTVGDKLVLRSLGATEVDGFDALDEVGGIEVIDNPGLGTWRAGSARVVHGDAVISGDRNLKAAPFLRDVTAVEGALTFRDLPKLEELNLADLRTVDGTLTVQSLDLLVELDGLYGIEAVGGDFVLRNNGRLTQAEFDALLADWGPSVVAGSIIAVGNGP